MQVTGTIEWNSEVINRSCVRLNERDFSSPASAESKRGRCHCAPGHSKHFLEQLRMYAASRSYK